MSSFYLFRWSNERGPYLGHIFEWPSGKCFSMFTNVPFVKTSGWWKLKIPNWRQLLHFKLQWMTDLKCFEWNEGLNLRNNNGLNFEKVGEKGHLFLPVNTQRKE